MNSSEIKIAWIWLSQNLSPSGHCAGFSLGFSIYHKYTNNNYFSIENATKMWIDAFSSLFRRQDKKNTQDLILGWLSQPQQQRLTRLILKSNSKFSFLSKSYEDTPTKMKKRDSKKLDRKFHWTDRIGKSQPSLCGDYTWLPLTRQCSSAASKYGKLEMRRSQYTSTSSYGLLFVQHKIWFLAASIAGECCLCWCC